MMDSMELIGQATEEVAPQLTVEDETESYARLVAEPRARNLAEEHRVGEPDPIALRGQLEVPVVVVFRRCDVG